MCERSNTVSTFTDWLEMRVNELAHRIASHPVFDSETPATRDELDELKRLCVIHRFLSQELERRSGATLPVPNLAFLFPASAA